MIARPSMSRDECFACDAALTKLLGQPLPLPLFTRLTSKERLILDALRCAYPEPLPVLTLALVVTPPELWPQRTLQHTLESHMYRVRMKLLDTRAPLTIRTLTSPRGTRGVTQIARYALHLDTAQDMLGEQPMAVAAE